jgi:hypothetical protein
MNVCEWAKKLFEEVGPAAVAACKCRSYFCNESNVLIKAIEDQRQRDTAVHGACDIQVCGIKCIAMTVCVEQARQKKTSTRQQYLRGWKI